MGKILTYHGLILELAQRLITLQQLFTPKLVSRAEIFILMIALWRNPPCLDKVSAYSKIRINKVEMNSSCDVYSSYFQGK